MNRSLLFLQDYPVWTAATPKGRGRGKGPQRRATSLGATKPGKAGFLGIVLFPCSFPFNELP